MNKYFKRISISLMVISSLFIVSAGEASAYDVPRPNPTAAGQVNDLTNKVNSLLGIFMYIVIAGCVAGLFMVAFKMATSYRNGEFGESAGKLAAVAGACIIVAAASGFVSFMVNDQAPQDGTHEWERCQPNKPC